MRLGKLLRLRLRKFLGLRLGSFLRLQLGRLFDQRIRKFLCQELDRLLGRLRLDKLLGRLRLGSLLCLRLHSIVRALSLCELDVRDGGRLLLHVRALSHLTESCGRHLSHLLGKVARILLRRQDGLAATGTIPVALLEGLTAVFAEPWANGHGHPP